MINTNKLTKDFGNNKGIFDISIDIKPGQIVGLIGPNGAGKSTLINLLTGLYFADSGSFSIFGMDTNPHNISSVLSKIGIMFSEIKEIPSFDSEKILSRYLKLQVDTDINIKSEVDNLSRLFQVQTNKPFKNLSLGNKKKISIIKTLAHKPELVILDEPTSGLDPLIQKKLLNELLKVKERNGSVFLSSHVLNEVEAICDTIIMIKDGRIISQSKTQDLIHDSYKVISLPITYLKEVNKIQEKDTNIDLEIINNKLKIKTKSVLPFINLAKKHKIEDIQISRPTLEELFMDKY